MKQTPLIAHHRAAGAKLVDFAGWEMPIQYSGVIDEYQTVRRSAGLFDVSHMGRLMVSGVGGLEFLQSVTTNDAGKLAVGQAQYSMVCNDRGGIQDDIFVYRLKPMDYLLCVNASNREKIHTWLQTQPRATTVVLEDHSDRLAQIAIQGPRSRDILLALGGEAIRTLKLHHTCDAVLGSIPTLVARTGYTGELGYELYVPADHIGVLWERILEQGASQGVKPAGLGSRDLLRLEMGYLLYGNDIGEDTTPIEAGVEWTVSLEKGEFIGRAALLAQKERGPATRFVGFELLEKAVPRHGFKILDAVSSQVIGEVSSGNLSPILQKGIGLGYIPTAQAAVGTPLTIDIRGRAVPAQVVKTPFYRRKA
ncbi:MAG: glycine cleavage system aminomethyltransferase GcvT [Nitrospira sp.]|jgi:aminomethyltransferase|nr:glycine cleavage system aminomethyltransferase GcvT [Nitrospira sp.]